MKIQLQQMAQQIQIQMVSTMRTILFPFHVIMDSIYLELTQVLVVPREFGIHLLQIAYKVMLYPDFECIQNVK